MSKDPLDRPATPEEIEMVERLLERTRSAENGRRPRSVAHRRIQLAHAP